MSWDTVQVLQLMKHQSLRPKVWKLFCWGTPWQRPPPSAADTRDHFHGDMQIPQSPKAVLKTHGGVHETLNFLFPEAKVSLGWAVGWDCGCKSPRPYDDGRPRRAPRAFSPGWPGRITPWLSTLHSVGLRRFSSSGVNGLIVCRIFTECPGEKCWSKLTWSQGALWVCIIQS